MGRVRDLGKLGDGWAGETAAGVPVRGTALSGSHDVRVNDLPALRTGDVGVAHTPEGPRMWRAAMGATRVRVNGELLHRTGDLCTFAGGVGRVEGREAEARAASTAPSVSVPSTAYRVKRRRNERGELEDYLYVRSWGATPGDDDPATVNNVVAGVIFAGETFHVVHRSPNGQRLWGRGDGRHGGYTGYGYIIKTDRKTGRPTVKQVRAAPLRHLRAYDPHENLRLQVPGIAQLFGVEDTDGVAVPFRPEAAREMFHRRGGEAWVELDARERLRVRYRTRDGWCMARAERADRWGFVREGDLDLTGVRAVNL